MPQGYDKIHDIQNEIAALNSQIQNRSKEIAEEYLRMYGLRDGSIVFCTDEFPNGLCHGRNAKLYIGRSKHGDVTLCLSPVRADGGISEKIFCIVPKLETDFDIKELDMAFAHLRFKRR